MSVVDDELTYAIQCAECRAIQIAKQTKQWQDVQDYKQDILLDIINHADSYNPAKAKPKTFIAMLSVTAMKRILRRLNNKKNRIIKNAKRV